MKDIKVNNQAELLSILANTDIGVPCRTDGRETEHCERWSICRLLATLANHNRLDFPMELLKRERPDFLLKTGGRHIGVEVTEAINPDYAKATTLPEANLAGGIIDPSLFKWGTPPRPLNDLRSIVSQRKLTGPGWEGSSVEVEYANAILDVMSSKTKKLRSQTFDNFPENWLIIYCNLTLPQLDIEEANLLFTKKAKDNWTDDSFSKVFVEKGQKIICYSQGVPEALDLANI
jgi:hypothetical protein